MGQTRSFADIRSMTADPSKADLHMPSPHAAQAPIAGIGESIPISLLRALCRGHSVAACPFGGSVCEFGHASNRQPAIEGSVQPPRTPDSIKLSAGVR
jgi:hypothetical protein